MCWFLSNVLACAALFITAWVILIPLPRKKLLVVEEAAAAEALHDSAQNITHCYIPWYEFFIQHI